MSSLPSTMKAAQRVGSGPLDRSLEAKTIPLPKAATSLPADRVLVKVAYTSLNPVDYKFPEMPLVGPYLNSIPCVDFSGTVVKSTSSSVREGDKVYGQTEPPKFGAAAEYIVVEGKQCMPAPEGLRLEEAATIGVAAVTAYQTVVPFVKPGSKVLINGGSGGVGTFTIQIAKVIGCYVTATCSGRNAELCTKLGADEVIDYRTQNVVDTLTRSGKQYDLIIDNVFADASLYWSCHKYLKPEGRFITIGGSPKLSVLKDMLSCLLWPRVLGGGQRKFQFLGRKTDKGHYEQIVAWMREGRVKPVIEKVYELEDIKSAFERLKTGRVVGKLVVRVS